MTKTLKPHYDKAMRVIRSCSTREQLEVAEAYVHNMHRVLFYRSNINMCFWYGLDKALDNKRMEILFHRFNPTIQYGERL